MNIINVKTRSGHIVDRLNRIDNAISASCWMPDPIWETRFAIMSFVKLKYLD